jgi:hypothetical protein
VIHFPEYYEYYHCFRPKPADLGLKNWSAYTPVSEQQAASGGDFEKRNLGAFILLYHYEWLRQAQRFGRRAKAHGGTHSYTLNPEDLGNGGDYVFLTFLADAGTPYIEYFGGPSVRKALITISRSMFTRPIWRTKNSGRFSNWAKPATDNTISTRKSTTCMPGNSPQRACAIIITSGRNKAGFECPIRPTPICLTGGATG